MISRAAVAWCAVTLTLGGCSAPPLTLYTLGTAPPGSPAIVSNTAPFGKKPTVIAVARVTIPDELDTEDIIVRDGSTLRRSRLGRWASRLSLGITDRMTQRLAERRPEALVTARPLTETPTYRVLINIGRLEVSDAGVATLDADWLIVSRDVAAAPVRDRGHFTATGPVATDQDVVNLMEVVLDQLSTAVDVKRR
jgi:uncharacterized lipoprotein YmbA